MTQKTPKHDPRTAVVQAEIGVDPAFGSVPPPLLMTAISDQLAPLSEMQELRDRLEGPSELYTFTSLYGHDAFLKEWDAMAPRLAAFCGALV